LAGRPAPSVDRTVFTNASAAMASAFLRAAQVLEMPEMAEIALRGLDWLLKECATAEGVAHYHDGKPQLAVLVRDPIALASALLDAFDHTGDRRRLEAAEGMTEALPKRFWCGPQKALADRAVDALDRGELAKLKVNLHENALAADNFARLWRITGKEEHRAWA